LLVRLHYFARLITALRPFARDDLWSRWAWPGTYGSKMNRFRPTSLDSSDILTQ
jgi:hypothetical protein